MGGQYFTIVILEKNKETIRIWLDPCNYEEGNRLIQHAYINNHLMGAIEYLLCPQGQYYKSPIIWAGEYTKPEEYNLYSKCKLGDYKHQTPPSYDTRSYRYIVNHTKKMYVDKYPDGDCGKIFRTHINKIHPLPLLVMDNVNEYKESYVGTWSGDIISVEVKPLEEYTKLDY